MHGGSPAGGGRRPAFDDTGILGGWLPQPLVETLGDGNRVAGGRLRLDASKSWVTAAGEASSYVWSSRPLAAEGGDDLVVRAPSARLSEPGKFDGLGLRGNRSAPIEAWASSANWRCWERRRRARPGAGRGPALVPHSECGVQRRRDGNGNSGSRRSHRLHQAGTPRSDSRRSATHQGRHARMRVWTDQAAALLADTLAAVEAERDDAVLRVLEVKAAAGEAAIAVTDLAMKICGGCRLPQGARYRALVPDAQAAGHGAHDRCPARFRRARYQRHAAAMTSSLLLGAVAYDPKVVTIWDGFRVWLAEHDFAFDYVLYSNYERQVEDLIGVASTWPGTRPWPGSAPRGLSRQSRAVAMQIPTGSVVGGRGPG